MEKKSKTKEQLSKELIKLKTKLAEWKLFETQQQFVCDRIKTERREIETILDSLPIGISIISEGYKIQYENILLRKRFGDSRDKICHKVYRTSNTPCQDCPISKSMKNESISQSEIKEKDGRYYELIAKPIGKYRNKNSWIEIIIDITEQKKEQEKAGRDQEKYIDLINELNVGVFKTTPGSKGIFLDVNQAMVDMFEAGSKKDLMKYKPHDMYADKDKRIELSGKLIKYGFIKDEEYEFITHSGKKFWGALTAVKKQDEKGNEFFNGTIEDISKRRKLEEKLYNLSIIDDLTGLYNRRGFFTIAEQNMRIAKRRNMQFAIFYIDIDNMKQINDTMGHIEGDRILTQFANILKKTCRESDIVSRIGGDEFVALAISMEPGESDAFVVRMNKNIDAYNKSISNAHKLSISVGIVNTDPTKKYSIGELVSQADRVMYEQKRGHKVSNCILH